MRKINVINQLNYYSILSVLTTFYIFQSPRLEVGYRDIIVYCIVHKFCKILFWYILDIICALIVSNLQQQEMIEIILSLTDILLPCLDCLPAYGIESDIGEKQYFIPQNYFIPSYKSAGSK